jgi:hypothetical protein
MPPHSIFGEYYFRKHEMVSGFNFSKDGTFQFFFSYGAVDRQASGTFEVEGDVVKLKSDKEPGKDFIIEKQGKQAGGGYHIAVKHPNAFLLNYIVGVFFVGEEQHVEQTGSSGEIHVDLPHCDKIFVQHGLFPDILTLIKDADNDNNYFELSLSPSLDQVSFKGIDLKIEGEALTCLPNYFMPMEGIAFVKKGSS